MSFKAKNLEYAAEEPAFLRRLRAQNGGFDDRHERTVPRPKRARLENDEDDAPAYVVEGSGENLTKEEYEALVTRGEGKAGETTAGSGGVPQSSETKASGGSPDQDDEGRKARVVAEAGVGGKKRKVAKVVGEDDEVADSKALPEKSCTTPGSGTKKKPKKRGKPIKLSFNDDEGP